MINNHINIEAEQSVLGGLILTTDQKRIESVARILKPQTFSSKANGDIYKACMWLINAGETPDLVTLEAKLKNSQAVTDLGGFAYIAHVANSTPSAANIIAYAKIVKETHDKRNLINVVTNCIEVATKNSQESIQKQLDTIYACLEAFGEEIRSGRSNDLVPMSQIMVDVVESLERRAAGDEKGLTTGIKQLDALLGYKGVVSNALMVIGARPKMGKTSVLTKIIEHIAIDLDLTVPFFSLEMANREVGERMLSQSSRVNLDDLMGGDGSKDHLWGMVSEAMGRLNTDNILISDKPSQSLREIVTAARRLKRERGKLGAIGVDYLTLMEGEESERNDLKYGAITKGLKALAKELDCPVILLTQLNRQLENRPNKRPKPSDSRDTGQIEQDCDYWIGLYRDEVYNPETNCPGFMELGLELNRHGSTGVALARMIQGRVEDIESSDIYVPYEDQQQERGGRSKDF